MKIRSKVRSRILAGAFLGLLAVSVSSPLTRVSVGAEERNTVTEVESSVSIDEGAKKRAEALIQGTEFSQRVDDSFTRRAEEKAAAEERARQEAEERARQEAEERARQEAEAARLKAEKEAEAKRKEEAKKKAEAAAAARKTTAETVSKETTEATSVDDIDLLAAIVEWEAGNQPYEGKVAVANVVLNRLKSGKWGSSVSSVVYAKSQFSGANSSKFAALVSRGASAACYVAARAAQSGENYVGSRTSFKATYLGVPSGALVIGDHCFY